MNELVNYFNSLGIEGASTLWLLMPLMALLVVGYVAYKIISFIVSIIVMLLLFVAVAGYFMMESDVNWRNLNALNNKTTDMLIVGKGESCVIHAANRDVQEKLDIKGWKTYFNACEKATEKLNIIAKQEGYKKMEKISKETPDCSLLLVTDRGQLYLEMLVHVNNNQCNSSEKFKEIINRLNSEEKENNGTLKKIKDGIIDFVVKDVMK